MGQLALGLVCETSPENLSASRRLGNYDEVHRLRSIYPLGIVAILQMLFSSIRV